MSTSRRAKKREVRFASPLYSERPFLKNDVIRYRQVGRYATRSKGEPSFSEVPDSLEPGLTESQLGKCELVVSAPGSRSSIPSSGQAENVDSSLGIVAELDNAPQAAEAPSPHTVRIELLPYDKYDVPDVTPRFVYVDVKRLEVDEFGVPTCYLSEALPLAREFESPLKRSTVKLWRLDQARMPISLGRADIVTDPAMNVRTIAKHRFLDKHQIKLEQPSRQYAFYSGVCLLWKDARPAVQEGQPAELPTCESPPTNDMTEWPQMEDLGVPRIEETARSKPARRDHRKQNAKVQWLRQYFTLLPDRLPGDLNCALARQALDRYLVVSEARRRVKEVLDGKYPADAPSGVAGKRITHIDLYVSFGFRRSAWFDLDKRWDPKDGVIGLKGARTILDWVNEPDATLAGSVPKFEALNNLPLMQLPAMVKADREGRLHGELNY